MCLLFLLTTMLSLQQQPLVTFSFDVIDYAESESVDNQ